MNSNKIPDIYLYCDRWCEMCAYGSRCEAYASSGSLSFSALQEQDKKNREFWNKIEEIAPQADAFVKKRAAEKGIDLMQLEGIPRQVKFDLFQRKAVSNDILKAGRQYEDKVDDLLDGLAEDKVVAVVETALGGAYRLIAEPREDFTSAFVDTMFAIILRYQLQLYLKISRAFYSRGKAAEVENNSGTFYDDVSGVIHSTLEMIGRTTAAWYVVMRAVPEKYSPAIAEILILLTRLKNNLIEEFKPYLK